MRNMRNTDSLVHKKSWESVSTEIDAVVETDELLTQDELSEPESLLRNAQWHVAESAAELMTGLHTKSERQCFVERYRKTNVLLGTLAIQRVLSAYDETGDTGVAKQTVYEYLMNEKMHMVALDYNRRLDMSWMERRKEWLAHHKKTRFMGGVAVSAAATSSLFAVASEASDIFTIQPGTGAGIGGVTFLVLRQVGKSLSRTGPTKIGTTIKQRFNAGFAEYECDGNRLDVDAMPKRYAEKHLFVPQAQLSDFIVSYDAGDKEERSSRLSDMTRQAVDISQRSIEDRYGVTEKKKRKWLKRDKVAEAA